jgi:hypothetical protein
MAIRAESDPKFSRRFLYMGIAAIGFSLWSLYDGLIGYPHKQERALKFEELYSANKADQWEGYAVERGWSPAIPEQSKSEEEYRTSIFTQYSMFIVAGLVGLWLISIPLRSRGKWIESTGDGVTSSWGQSFKYADVENLEKRQWRSKGIAKVTYVENGSRRRFVIDDYKFDRYKTDAILYELEQNIDPERITGGAPDPPPGQQLEMPEPEVDESPAEQA